MTSLPNNSLPNRREAIRTLGVLAISATMPRVAATSQKPDSQKETQAQVSPIPPTTPLPSSVTGVRLVDSKIATEATELSRTVSPPYLFNHAVRTFLFASLVGKARAQKFDEEVLYLACILHDLGLTERFEGDPPFEIQGAESARHFLEERAYLKEKIGLVWDGIAMHASPIGQYKQPEIALVGQGAGADVLGPNLSQIQKSDAKEIAKAFPRLKFKEEFLKTCASVARKHPRGASNSFMRDIRERYVPEFHPQNFCDSVEQAPFPE